MGIAATPDGMGYWLVAADSSVYAHGDAGFFGSRATRRLNAPVVGIAATPGGKGYWLVASDGAVFAHGDAGFFGSLAGQSSERGGSGDGGHTRRQGVLACCCQRRSVRPGRRRVLRL